jgi:hypothetical protein
MKEHRLRGISDWPWKDFGSKRREVTGTWGRLYNEELRGFCFSPKIFG